MKLSFVVILSMILISTHSFALSVGDIVCRQSMTGQYVGLKVTKTKHSFGGVYYKARVIKMSGIGYIRIFMPLEDGSIGNKEFIMYTSDWYKESYLDETGFRASTCDQLLD